MSYATMNNSNRSRNYRAAQPRINIGYGGSSLSKGAFSYGSSLNSYNAYYGNNVSVQKQSKPISYQPSSYLASSKESINKLSSQIYIDKDLQDRKDKEKSVNLYRIRDSRQKRQQNLITNSNDNDYRKRIIQSSSKSSAIKMKQSEQYTSNTNKKADNQNTGNNFLKQLPQEIQIPIKISKNQIQQIFKTKTIGLVGLNNIGNTCFMNSILQCMFNLPKFNDYFLNNTYIRQLGGNSKVATAYGKTIHLIRNSSARAETPSEIKSAVASKKPRFSGYAQQDAQQFLAALLELLSIELNRVKNPKYKQLTADLNKKRLEQISEQWWLYNKQRQNSIVCDYFSGQLLSKVICCSCLNESLAFDNTWDFALNFSSYDNGEIIRMIQNFLKEQTISQDYYCSKCKNFRECKRKLDFYRLPDILILQIKRFSYGKYSKQKLNNRIKVPSVLDLGKVITVSKHLSTKNSIYDLVGIVNHSGEINFGHYTAECKNPINGKWYNFNDSSVSEIKMSDYFQSSTPYLLFYTKK